MIEAWQKKTASRAHISAVIARLYMTRAVLTDNLYNPHSSDTYIDTGAELVLSVAYPFNDVHDQSQNPDWWIRSCDIFRACGFQAMNDLLAIDAVVVFLLIL